MVQQQLSTEVASSSPLGAALHRRTAAFHMSSSISPQEYQLLSTGVAALSTEY
jgi:hypothetical protein